MGQVLRVAWVAAGGTQTPRGAPANHQPWLSREERSVYVRIVCCSSVGGCSPRHGELVCHRALWRAARTTVEWANGVRHSQRSAHPWGGVTRAQAGSGGEGSNRRETLVNPSRRSRVHVCSSRCSRGSSSARGVLVEPWTVVHLHFALVLASVDPRDRVSRAALCELQ